MDASARTKVKLAAAGGTLACALVVGLMPRDKQGEKPDNQDEKVVALLACAGSAKRRPEAPAAQQQPT